MIQYRSLHAEVESDNMDPSGKQILAIASSCFKKMGFKESYYPHVDPGTTISYGSGTNDRGPLGLFSAWRWNSFFVFVYTVGYAHYMCYGIPKPDGNGEYPVWNASNDFLSGNGRISDYFGIFYKPGEEKQYKLWMGINYYKVYNKLIATEFPERPDIYLSDQDLYYQGSPRAMTFYHGAQDRIIYNTGGITGVPPLVSYLNNDPVTKHAFPSLVVLDDHSDYVALDGLYNLNFYIIVIGQTYSGSVWTADHVRASKDRLFSMMGARFFAIGGYQALRI